LLLQEYNLSNPGNLWFQVDAQNLIQEMKRLGYVGHIATKKMLLPSHGQWWARLGLNSRKLCIWGNIVFLKESAPMTDNLLALYNTRVCPQHFCEVTANKPPVP